MSVGAAQLDEVVEEGDEEEELAEVDKVTSVVGALVEGATTEDELLEPPLFVELD
jgi:hypothetical protein